MLQTKYIFLDIDGVLCTDECAKKEYHEDFLYPFHSDCVSVLNEILRITNAEIVLSSDWRKLQKENRPFLDNLFKYNKVIKSPIACTPELANNRGLEITNYIEINGAKNFLILDDLPLPIFPSRFIQTNINAGLLEEGIKEKAIAILNG